MQRRNLNSHRATQPKTLFALTADEKDYYIDALERELDAAAKEIRCLRAVAWAGNTLGLATAGET